MAFDKILKEKAPKVKKFKAPKEKKEKELKLPKEKKEKVPKEKKEIKRIFSNIKLPEIKIPKFLKSKAPIKEDKKRVLTLSRRLLLLCLLPMIVACLMFTIFSASRLRSRI